jgi:predicted transposase YbfD/YdcC
MHDELNRKETLLELLEELPDPRLDHNKRHRVVDILTIAICGALCSVDNYVELERFARVKHKWFESFLELPNGIPSHDTIGRVLAVLDRKAFAEVFVRWLSSWAGELGDVQVAIDGKALRATVERSKKGSVLMLVSAFAVESGLVLGQVQTQEESNEIEAVPRLLQQLDLKGKLVTLDALHSHTETAQMLHERGAHYALRIKGNQPELRKSLDDHMRTVRGAPERLSSNHYFETVEKGHGRIETRRHFISDKLDALELAHLNLPDKWPGSNVIGCIERTRECVATGKVEAETALYLASLPKPDVHLFARVARGHWGIENKLHWVLDVAFDEDRCRVRVKNAAHNYGLIRKVAFNLLRQDKANKVGITCKRKMCGWDHDYMLQILRIVPAALAQW